MWETIKETKDWITEKLITDSSIIIVKSKKDGSFAETQVIWRKDVIQK